MSWLQLLNMRLFIVEGELRPYTVVAPVLYSVLFLLIFALTSLLMDAEQSLRSPIRRLFVGTAVLLLWR